MSTETPGAAGQSVLERHHYLLRRLHSLSGIVPIGLFLCMHLLTNASVVWGRIDGRESEYGHAGVATFQHEVNFIHSLPALVLIEIFGLWLPIAFHSILGVYYATTGRSNTGAYPYRDNWRYTLQRISGYIGLVFIFYHVATLRWGWTFLIPGGTRWDGEFAASTLAQVLRGHPTDVTAAGLAIAAVYMVCVTLLVFHFANGLWTSAITWGLTISQSAQRRWGQVCFGVGAALMLMAWSAVIGFMTLDPAQALETELRMNGEPAGSVAMPEAP